MIVKNQVSYIDFGAKGDGVTDDFAAIVKAHEYANENGLPVVIDDGRTYYIHDTVIDGSARSAIIRTDVNWGNASFIIDDTDIDYFDGTKRASTYIFDIKSDYEVKTVTDRNVLCRLDGIGEGTTKLDFAPGYPAMLVIYDENTSVFRRTGGNRSGKGAVKKELILVDSDGNVDSSTPFMFDYETVTRLDIIRDDVTPITVKGGKFTTRGCRVDAFNNETNEKAGYYARGIFINRSHTVIDGVEHYVTGEFTTYDHRDKLLEGPHYRGFYVASHANEITIQNCVLTGRRYYHVSGTYEFSGDMVNKIYLIGCTQSNFRIKDEEGKTVFSMAISPVSKTLYYWGIGGTNFCKNMEYINCTLSRFDAHQGLYNGKIIGCTMNFMELTGKGELLVGERSICAGGNVFRSHKSIDGCACVIKGISIVCVLTRTSVACNRNCLNVSIGGEAFTGRDRLNKIAGCSIVEIPALDSLINIKRYARAFKENARSILTVNRSGFVFNENVLHIGYESSSVVIVFFVVVAENVLRLLTVSKHGVVKLRALNVALVCGESNAVFVKALVEVFRNAVSHYGFALSRGNLNVILYVHILCCNAVGGKDVASGVLYGFLICCDSIDRL